MSYCEKCGSKIRESVSFCPSCGAKNMMKSIVTMTVLLLRIYTRMMKAVLFRNTIPHQSAE